MSLVFVRKEISKDSLQAQSSERARWARTLVLLAAWPPGTRLTKEKWNLLLWQKLNLFSNKPITCNGIRNIEI